MLDASFAFSLSAEDGQELDACHDANAFVLAQVEQIFVFGQNVCRSASERCCQDDIVTRIATNSRDLINGDKRGARDNCIER